MTSNHHTQLRFPSLRQSRLLLLVMLALGSTWVSAVEPVNTNFLGVAIKGYDPVAYFTVKEPTKGSKSYTYRWRDAQWRFANAENLATFKKNPEAYAPQYGGYCAWAVSQNTTADIDPKAWRIVDGKLYLNYSAKIQKKWDVDIPGYINQADENWPALQKR